MNAELMCTHCGSTTRIIRTERDDRTLWIKRRHECVACGERHTTREPPPLCAKPMTAHQSKQIDRRSIRMAVAMDRINHGARISMGEEVLDVGLLVG